MKERALARVCVVVLGSVAVFCLAPGAAIAQTADVTFVGVGQLSGGTASKCFGVSADGSLLVCDAVNSDGKTVAAIYDRAAPTTPTLNVIGLLNPTDKESHATDVGVDLQGVVHVCGWSQNSSDVDRAFHWSGDRLGVGSFTAIMPWSGTGFNKAYGLYIDPVSDEVFITGGSSGSASGASERAFRWRSGTAMTPASLLNLGDLPGGADKSRGRGIGSHGGAMYIVGVGQSSWGGGNDQREAFRWDSGDSTMYGTKGLDWVCTGEPWQISAGLNQIAETAANADNVQVSPVGTTGLVEPDAIVISCGADNRLKDQLSPSGDDIEWPSTNPGPDGGSESLFNAISPDARFMVGRSTYPGNAGGYFEADLRDVHNRDDYGSDNCGGIAFNWPLGVLPGDDYSEALGVSNGQGYDKTSPRTGTVVVGYSGYNFATGDTRKAFACFLNDDHAWGTDLWFLQHMGVAEGDNGASAANTYKGITDLRLFLAANGIDMTAWDLREADAVSDDGKVIVGWGVHNGSDEGFVATVQFPQPGACCEQTGWGSGTCTVVEEAACTGNWLGSYTTCDQCDFCPTPFADTDRDGDIDQADFAVFQACVTGIGGGVPAGCECFDRDEGGSGDGDIDQDDWGAFEAIATSPGIAWDGQ